MGLFSMVFTTIFFKYTFPLTVPCFPVPTLYTPPQIPYKIMYKYFESVQIAVEGSFSKL